MKLIDKEKGKILGINVFDLLIIIGIILIVSSFISTVKSKNTFDGSEIYKIAKIYRTALLKGFLIEAEIYGKDIVTKRELKLKGILVTASKGTLVIRTKDLEEISVGGPLAYMEEVSAKKIVLYPLYKYTVPIKYNVLVFNKSSLNYFLKELKNKYKYDYIMVSSDVIIQGKNVDVKKLYNKYIYGRIVLKEISDDFIYLYLTLYPLDRYLEIDFEKIIFIKPKIFLGYKKEPNVKAFNKFEEIL